MSSNWIASRGAKPRSQSKISVHTSSPAWPSGASRAGGVSGRSMKATRSVGHGNCTDSRKAYQKQHSEVAREHGKPRVRQISLSRFMVYCASHESRYAESALEGWGRVTGKMRKSFQW